MNVALLNPLLQAVVALALLGAYAGLRAVGTDEPVLLGLLAGQLAGHGITHLTAQVAGAELPPDAPAAPAAKRPNVAVVE